MTNEEKKIFLLLNGWKLFTSPVIIIDSISTDKQSSLKQHFAYVLGDPTEFGKLMVASDLYSKECEAIEWAYEYATKNHA